MLCLKLKIMMKPCFHLDVTFLSRQLDNDDANDDENDIDIFLPDRQHRTYEIPQRKQLLHHESIRNCKLQFLMNRLNTFTFYFSCNRILCSRKLLGTVTTIFE